MTTYFVGGAQRSGTTLLQGLLCSGETTNPLIYECFLFEYLINSYVRGKRNFEHHGKPYFGDLQSYRAYYARSAGDFLEQTRARYAPAQHLVLKETTLTREFPDIFELLPDTKFIVSVRDPRDVVASLIKVGERMRDGGKDNWYLNRDMKQFARDYKSFYQRALKEKDPAFRKNLLFVKYENLVNQPEAELAKILDFTGLELPRLQDGVWQRNDWDFKGMESWEPHRPWSSELWGKAVSKARIGSYREVLTDAEIAALEAECADVFHIFGYGKSDETAPVAEPAGERS